MNTLLLEITPTFVSIPRSLRVAGYTAGIRDVVSCAVRASDAGIHYTRGQQTATCTRYTQGGPVGHFRVSWPNPHPDGTNYVPQYSLIGNNGVVFSGTGAGERTSTSIVIKTQDCNVVFYNYDFWLTIN